MTEFKLISLTDNILSVSMFCQNIQSSVSFEILTLKMMEQSGIRSDIGVI